MEHKLAGKPVMSVDNSDILFMEKFQDELDLIALKTKTLGDRFNTGRAQLSFFKDTLERMWDAGSRPGEDKLFDDLIKRMKQLSLQQEAIDRLSESFSSFFMNIMTGTKSVAAAFKDMVGSVLQSFEKMIADMLAKKVATFLMNLIFPGTGAAVTALSGFGGGGSLGMYASGTSYAPGGWSMVGENGPELMNVPKGAQILPHGLSNLAMQPAVIQGDVRFVIEDNQLVGILRKANKKNNLY
jgi:hypothetical protein